MRVLDFLAHPLTRGLDINSPATTALRRRIVQEKAFLRNLYSEWYRLIRAELPAVEGTVLELGSGAGFMDETIEGLVTSEIFPTPGASVVLDGDRATGSQAFLFVEQEGHGLRLGRYDDEFVRRPEGWRFAVRKIVIMRSTPPAR